MSLLDAFTPAQMAMIGLAYFFAAVVKGVTGLGYASTCLPILTLALGLKDALPLVLIPSVASNVMVMTSAGRLRASATRFWPMLVCAAIGVFTGVYALTRVDGDSAAAGLGAVLVIYVAFSLISPAFRLDEARARPFEPLVGAMTGFVNGLTGSQVVPVIPYLLSLDLERARFLQASNLSFTISSAAMFVALGAAGIMTMAAVAISAAGLVCVATGVRLGQRMARRLSPPAFRRAVLVVLGALGIGLVLRAVSA